MKEKIREPKKLTGRDGVLTYNELNKHLERKRKKKTYSRFMNSEVSVLLVLVLLLQHPVLV
jgi:hypothetical protein